MLSNRSIKWITIVIALTSLFGCATTGAQTKAASQGNVIVVAMQDLRGANGRIMSDNAGGLPDALGRALGLPIGTVAGAVLDVAVGTAANVAANKVVETTQPIELKVISEGSCEDWTHVVVRAAVSPQTATLRPGSIAQVKKDPATGQLMIEPVVNASGAPTYLSKSDRCYDGWVTEWKEHQRIVGNHLPWGNHRGNDPLFGGVKLSNVGTPNYDYIR